LSVGWYSSAQSDEPIKYSASRASQWKAEYSREGIPDSDMPWFQPYIVLGSVLTFLLYFTVLREENDIDLSLSTKLYERIDGLEESQLRQALRYNLDNGHETSSIKKRLAELESERNQ
jgi:hypothetical protein